MKFRLPLAAAALAALALCLAAAAEPPCCQAPPAAAKKHGRGYRPLPAAKAKALHEAAFKRHGHLMRLLARNATPPAKFSCVDQGWVPPVRDQGNCGSCYLVSSSDAVTCAFIKSGWGKADDSFKISDQYGLDCQSFGGCDGGDEAEVIDFIKGKGFPAERYIDPATGNSASDYGAYTANPGRCALKAGARLWQVQDWGYVAGDQGSGPATLAEIKAALMKYGVLSIALDASAFDGYDGGVIPRLGNSIDHAITMVGWDDSASCVICRNNWGTDWGERGYCRISYNAVPQIVEPIWVQATPVVPPPVPPGPGPVPPGPAPGPATVTITLTPDQVQAVLTAAGAGTTLTPDMTLDQLRDLLNRMPQKKAGPRKPDTTTPLDIPPPAK